jgi:hypothetical protein
MCAWFACLSGLIFVIFNKPGYIVAVAPFIVELIPINAAAIFFKNISVGVRNISLTNGTMKFLILV